MLEMTKTMGQVKVLRHLTGAQPFVFNKDFKGILDETEEPLDLPFKICSFELFGQNTMWIKNPVTGEDNEIVCIVAEEMEPQKIVFYVLGNFGKGPEIKWFHPDDHGSNWWVICNSMIQVYLSNLKNGQHGFTSPRTIFKWKDAGTKQQMRINKVIYVRPKNKPEEDPGEEQVTWSHAFWVMGHWRTISGIGKDRNDNYCVSGKTWVVPYVKNKELGDPVTKIRFKS